MASLQRAQTGNRVYGGVGQAPNRGQVSAKGAQGYLKRELNRNQGGVRQPVGRDGKSDSRSGVAARALGNSGIGRPGAGGLKKPPNKNKAMGVKPTGMTKPPVSGPTAEVVAPPPPPQVKVNANGILELPYSQNLSQAALQAVQGSNEELLALQQEEQQMNLEVMQGRRDADTQYGQLQQTSLNTNAAGGTAFSSMYGKQVSDNATSYSNTLGDLSRRESEFKQNASLRRATIMSALNEQLMAAAQENAVELGEEAGNLGFGNYQGETHSHNENSQAYGNRPNKPKPKPKPKPKEQGKDHGGPVKATGGPVKKGKK